MSDNTSNNKRIAKNSIFLSIRMVIVLAISLYTTRVILRVLGVEDYGVYNVVCGFVSMFAFLNTSMSNGIQRFFNYEFQKNGEEGANKVFNIALLIQFLLAVLIIVVAETVGLWYLHNKMVIPDGRMIAAEWIFQFTVIGFVFLIMQAPFSASIMAHEKMDVFAIIGIIDALLNLGIVLVLPFLSGDYLILYGLLHSLIRVLNFSLNYFYSRFHFKEIRFNLTFHKQLFGSMLSFSGWNIFGSFSHLMKEEGINLLLNYFFGTVVNAARGVAAQISSGMQSFVSNLVVPVRPQIVKSYADGNYTRTMNLMYSISKLSCLFLYLISLPVLFQIDFILDIWLDHTVPDHTSIFVIIVVLTSFLNNLNAAVSIVVHASGKMRNYQVITSIIVLSAIPLSYVALKLGASPESSLWITFLTMVIVQMVSLFILRGIIDFSILAYFKRVLLPIAYVIVTTIWVPVVLNIVITPGIYQLISVLFLSMLITCFSIYFVGLDKSERDLVYSFIKRFLPNRLRK